MKNRRRVVIAVMLMISIGNYFRIHGNEEVRPILFLSIFVIGALTGLLIANIKNASRHEN